LPRREYRRQRALARGYDSTYGKGQQRMAAAKAVEEQNARERAALRTREAKLAEEVQSARAGMKTVGREAASAVARGHRSERWAHTFVFGEEGEILEDPERRMVASAAHMLARGHIDRRTALHTAVQREVCNPDLLCRGSQVWYQQQTGSLLPVTIVAVHADCLPACYTIRFDSGMERQTEHSRLTLCPDLPATPNLASVYGPTSTLPASAPASVPASAPAVAVPASVPARVRVRPDPHRPVADCFFASAPDAAAAAAAAPVTEPPGSDEEE
jgi:hypothetical protein